MTPFWNGFFEHLRSCGRNGVIFVCSLLGLLATVVLMAILERAGVVLDERIVLPAVGVSLALWIGVFIRRMRAERKCPRLPRLSDDELRVARERLKGRRSA